VIGMKPTPYAPVRHLNIRALDEAYVRYHYGSVQWGAARNDMIAAGVTLFEAEGLLTATDRPSKRYTLPRRTP
jgi:hypothetical protein